MEELILENKNLIYSIAKYFENYSNKDDLFQAGCIGMINAYKNYDSSMNVKFTTYAYPYILGEMKKFIRQDKSIKISRNIQIFNLKIEKARMLLTQKNMKEPTDDEIAEYLDLPLHIISDAINSNKAIYSIDAPINDSSLTLSDMIGSSSNLDDLILLREELSKLSKFERDLISKRYFSDLTQKEAAIELGISQVQVSRNEKKIIKKLRDGFENKLVS